MTPLTGSRDTICALASARGRAGVAVLRVSGPDALAVSAKCFRTKRGATTAPRRMVLGNALDAEGQPLDQALGVYFPPSASYTGEPVIELHLHGSPAVVEASLAALIQAGARPALPGEFTKRAFLAGRIDLAQAEAVAELIEARSLAAARAAHRRLTGALSVKVGALRRLLAEAMALFEAEIDFPDDDLGRIDRNEAAALIAQAQEGVGSLLAGHARARALARGAIVVLAGRPNAGKSSLLNRLAGARRAIVHESAGTTRDAVEVEIALDGVPIRLVDTAGLRQPEHEVERQGVELARQAIAGADLTVYLIDGGAGVTPEDRALLGEMAAARTIVAWNKCDARPPDDDFAAPPGLAISAVRGDGIDDLQRRIVAALHAEATDGEALLAAERHRQLALTAQTRLTEAARLVAADAEPELPAMELRDAANALAEIVGETTTEQVLDAVFARFCVGK